MHNLGMLEISSGNEEMGMKWLKKAADNKHPIAAQVLREMKKERKDTPSKQYDNDVWEERRNNSK